MRAMSRLFGRVVDGFIRVLGSPLALVTAVLVIVVWR